MRIGIDIVKISRVLKLMDRPETARKIFHVHEISGNADTMAGILAAKEAYFKAMGKKGEWLDVEVKKRESGQPELINEQGERIGLSISHDGDYAVAVVIIC
jgi:phosphopantetheine--protein transferase-like protein